MSIDNSGHQIQADIDYVGAFLFETAEREREEHHEPREHTRDRPPHVAPRRMVPPENPEDLPGSPPPVSGYRPADVQGVACWNCGHFTCCEDSDDDGVVDGICNLWETQAEGEFTCDRFTAHPDLFRQQPHTSWREDREDEHRDSYDKRYDRGPGVMEADYSDQSAMNEIRLSGSDAEESEGLVWKNILRTGTWNSMPTTKGVIKKKLKIVKDGVTDIAAGVISLTELLQNFEDRAVPYVTVPLSDDEKDHKNIARLNTGLVKKLKLVQEGDTAFLRAGIDFTEPDVKDKVLRGTIPDCSAGIPFGVTRRSDDKFFSSVLDHVCLTRKPFVDGLGPFGIAAADSDTELPTEAWEQEGESSLRPNPTEAPPQNSDSPSFRAMERLIRQDLVARLVDLASYDIEDVGNNYFVIRHRVSNVAWKAGFKVEGEVVYCDPVGSWTMIEEEESEKPEAAVPITASDRLHQAHELRALRLSQPTSESGGIEMSTLNLDGVELSDDARTRVQAILAENESLRATTREGEADKRIDELSQIPGLKDRPGALKLYRSVMLADDGGLAVVFSDSGRDQSYTAKELLDQFIDALKGDNGIQLSDQALASGNDTKPPLNADGERKPLEERVEDSRTALYGKNGKRRTGRK